MGTPSHSYGTSLAIWDHTVITCYPTQVNAPRLTQAMQAGTQFTYRRGMVNKHWLRLGRYKAGMCDAAWCAPCTWVPLRWAVPTKRRYNKCPTFTLLPLYSNIIHIADYNSHKYIIYIPTSCHNASAWHLISGISSVILVSSSGISLWWNEYRS